MAYIPYGPQPPSFPGFGTGESNYGSAPYQEAAAKAQFRLGLKDRLLAGLAGLGSVQPGMNFGQSFISAAGGSARATWAAKQAAMNYAQRQQDQEIARQNAETQRMLAEGAAKAKEPPPPKVSTKQQDYENLVRPISEGGIGLDPVKARQIVYGLTPDEKVSTKPAVTAKPEPLVKVAGPDGQTIYVPRSQAVGKPAPKTAVKPPTAGERRSSGALDRADSLDRSATEFEKGLTTLQSQLPLKLPYAIQPLLQKQYTNARKAFTETVLREFSGAAISKDEYDKYDQIFFAQPGDDKTTLEQKRQMRAGIMGQLRSMSGAAAMQEGRAGLALRVDELKKSLGTPASRAPASGGLEGYLR